MKTAMNRFKGNEGVIMMETILVLPLYLVLFAGIFWLGETCIARQTLETAERLCLWESGVRHSGLQRIPERGIFEAFPQIGSARSEVVTGVGRLSQMQARNTTGFSSVSSSGAWGTVTSGYVQIDAWRSNWSWGISDFTENVLWNYDGSAPAAVSGTAAETMVSSGTDRNPIPGTIAFRTTTGGIRSNIILTQNGRRYLPTSRWNSIYHESWNFYDDSPETFSGSSVNTTQSADLSEYNNGYRDSQLNGWSK